ncbi:response regulator transcription factor [Marinospirillum sp.]|uniref:response regulator transcription factor n=1 Tax=Marinospirillum sp. TaxID=2183934 RepID=UPI00384E6A4B
MNATPHVYVVDDDELVLETLDSVFTFAGFTVTTFNQAKDFLAASLEPENSCLILDLRMPHMSGLELQRSLIERQIDLPVIIYSGNADVATTVRAMSGGAFTLVQKPLSNDLLIETVREAMKSHQQAREENAGFIEAEQRLQVLSEREKTVARLAAEGLTATEIADQLCVSTRTAEAHKANIFKKLNIRSVAVLAQLVLMARLKH